DPTVRRTQTPDGREFTYTDTVGFVRHLPTQLVEAFRSTLEEVGDADLLLHVVDASHPDPEGQIRGAHGAGGAGRLRRDGDRRAEQGRHRRAGDPRAPAQPGR